MDRREVAENDAVALVNRDESHFWDHKSCRSKGTVIQKIASGLANADGGDFAIGIEMRPPVAVWIVGRDSRRSRMPTTSWRRWHVI